MMEEYKAFVIDDEPSLLGLLVQFLGRYGIAARSFATAEACLEVIRNTELAPALLPDMILVDLELEAGRMRGQDLIGRLNDLDVPSEIVAISGTAPPSELEAAIGIGASSFVSKPFDILSLGPTLERVARIGKDRRMYRMRASGPPTSSSRKRRDRPVFLSYSDHDARAANFLRKSLEARGVGVWYAPTALHPGDEFRKQIDTGVDCARVFITMLSNSYSNSNFCLDELAKFTRRAEQDPSLVLVPVILDIDPDAVGNLAIRRVLDRVHYIRFQRVIDCLTVVLGRIQLALEAPPQSSRIAEVPPASGGR